MGQGAGRKLNALYAAFAADGWRPARAYLYGGRLGVMAEHKAVREYETGRVKRCFYVEGSPYERGYLLGLLAEPDVAEMATRFTDNVVFDFLNIEFLNRFPLLQKLLVELLYELSETAWSALPGHIHEETQGLLAGCKKRNPRTPVTMKRLTVMNVAFDVLCAIAYSGEFFRRHAPGEAERAVRLALMCNAFSVYGAAAGGGHYFARDFMFASGDVFQNHIAHVVHVPAPQPGSTLHPYVSVTAPGMVGSISAMNDVNVAVGVNMSPGANSTPSAVGLNSLLLARDAILYGGSAREAANVILNAQRGVAWNYPLSDGTLDTACTVEAGASGKLDYLSYPDASLRPFLPDAAFFAAHPDAPLFNGGMARWCGKPFPKEYFTFNPGLWKQYQQTVNPSVELLPGAFAPDGFINRTPQEKNCPSTFYFAPQRTEEGVHITGNHYLLPRMRLCAMDPWTAKVVGNRVNDIQWRYDALNSLLRETLRAQGSIDHESARKLADFLAPYGSFPAYYARNPRSADQKQVRIEGCVSLFDLKQGTVESHYGYYGDGWVRTTLGLYL